MMMMMMIIIIIIHNLTVHTQPCKWGFHTSDYETKQYAPSNY